MIWSSSNRRSRNSRKGWYGAVAIGGVDSVVKGWYGAVAIGGADSVVKGWHGAVA